MAPPQASSGMPRCWRYQAASAALSCVLLKKTPPIPVTLAIAVSSDNEVSDVRRHTVQQQNQCYESQEAEHRSRFAPARPGGDEMVQHGEGIDAHDQRRGARWTLTRSFPGIGLHP